MATYNRSTQLRRAIESYLRAAEPATAKTQLLVVDNNSKDDTRSVAQSYVDRHDGRVGYLFVARQGKAHALNAAISQSDADVIAMFDDDEIVEADWLIRLADRFADPTIDFIGGKVLPNWEVAPPAWLPQRFNGVIGHIDHGDAPRYFWEGGFDAMLVGGNTAIRREILDRCGPYAAEQTYAEDRYMDAQLRRIGARGLYDPLVVVKHDVPAWRMTQKYYRHWAFTEGNTRALADLGSGSPLPHFLGAPRWMWRRAVANLATCMTQLGSARAGQRFQAQLELIELYGYLLTRLRGPSPYLDRTTFRTDKSESG